MIILTSPDFKSGGLIPSEFTCQGSNINPTLLIASVPKKAASLALIMDDPDAPNGTFTHWVLWNIDPTTTEISPGIKPKNSVVGQNGAGQNKYTGPCPPDGTHRYFIKIYALDTMLDLPATTTGPDLAHQIDKHRLDYGQMLGIYQKPLF